MTEITVSSISEFVAVIEQQKYQVNLWFRGVSDIKYSTVPGLMWKGLIEDESNLVHRFLASYRSHTHYSNLDEWEIYGLMQHHGLPTRLLDWSESALVALFFALASEPDSDTIPAVYIMDPYELNRNTTGVSELYCPSIITDRYVLTDTSGTQRSLDSFLPSALRTADAGTFVPADPIAIMTTQYIKRVSAQKGCFTVHGTNQNSIDSYISAPESFQVIKIDTSKYGKSALLRSLAALGINHEFIYQDLDSLSKRVIDDTQYIRTLNS